MDYNKKKQVIQANWHIFGIIGIEFKVAWHLRVVVQGAQGPGQVDLVMGLQVIGTTWKCFCVDVWTGIHDSLHKLESN